MKYHITIFMTFSVAMLSGHVHAKPVQDTKAITSQKTLKPAFRCMIEPKKIVDVRSPIVGLMKHLHVKRGDVVRKGQKLAELDSGVERSANKSAYAKSQASAQVLSARNKLSAAKKKAKRFEQLYHEEFVSAQARDDAKNEARLARAELKLALENKRIADIDYKTSSKELDRRIIRSPLSGVVMAQYLNAGSIVGPTEGKNPILRIAQHDQLKITTVLPFKYFNDVRKGQWVTIVPEKPFAKRYRARVAIKDRVVDSASGTFRIISYMDNRRVKIPSGILCETRL